MTAHGDGLNFDFLDEPSPAKKPPVPPESSLPETPPAEIESTGVLDGFLDDVKDKVPDDGHSNSIFDESPVAPVNSVDEIPKALPNISGGDTEILVRGRTELRDFTEDFGAGPLGTLPAETTAEALFEGTPEFAAALTDASVEHQSPPLSDAIQNPLGGLFFPTDEEGSHSPPPPSEADPANSHEDTVITEFSLPSRPVSAEPETPTVETTPEPVALESDETLVTADPPEVSLDGLNDSGLSLSSVTSGGFSDSAPATTASSMVKAAPAPGGSRVAVFALGGYALLVTALCVMLLMMLSKAREAGQLESLPDLKPIPPGKVAIYKINTELPAGHTLHLGDHQRYGNLRVEPLKVTRGTIQFQHFEKTGKVEDYNSDTVLKLWVKFTNESKEQAFVPLDSDLMFRRHRDAQDVVRANNFLVQTQDKPRSYPLVFVFDHPQTGDWDMAGQQLGKELQPGESLETYIPTTEEGIDRLKGELLWRVQLRKGHSPRGNGVTTLVEVAFTADQIQSEGT